MNPLLQGHSESTPETSRNMFSINQGTNVDDSQSNPHPEAGLLTSVREDRHDMVTAVEGESVDGHDMVTGVHEEVMYCSPSTSSGKQKKNCSTSQPQFRSEDTPVTNEADQILLALQQLAITTILRISTTIITELTNCQSRLRQRCPRSTGNLKSSSCLKICSKRVSKSTIS